MGLQNSMIFKGLSIAFLYASAVHSIDETREPELVVQIGHAATRLDRMAILKKDRDWIYDFERDCDEYTFSPGSVCNANRATFPATTGQGMTMAMLNLGACAMLPPHFHPRASNYVMGISGTTVTYMIEENGAPVITTELTKGKMTIFPQGSVHAMINTGMSSCWDCPRTRSPLAKLTAFILADITRVRGCPAHLDALQ